MSTKTQAHRPPSRPGHASHGEMQNGNAETPPVPAEQNGNPEERIQVCAYSLWEQAGKPDGDDARVRFWCEAEKAVLASCKR